MHSKCKSTFNRFICTACREQYNTLNPNGKLQQVLSVHIEELKHSCHVCKSDYTLPGHSVSAINQTASYAVVR